jgi:hypothetical protein
MVARDRLGDRRAAVRFELGGRLWGTLETMEPLPVRNVGRGGLLVESPAPLEIDSVHRVQLVLSGRESIAEARVRHVTGIHDVVGGSRYLVGFQFVTVEESALAEIDRLIVKGGVPPAGTEVV